MTWEMIAALISIVGSLIALGKVLAKLIGTLTKLDDTLIALKADFDRLRDGNKEAHRTIFSKLDEHSSRLTELERE